LRTLKISTILT